MAKFENFTQELKFNRKNEGFPITENVRICNNYGVPDNFRMVSKFSTWGKNSLSGIKIRHAGISENGTMR